jgi:RimJ/RimL family protein N-acetyltransferase
MALLHRVWTQKDLEILSEWFEDAETKSRFGGYLPLEKTYSNMCKIKNQRTFIFKDDDKMVGLATIEEDKETYISILVNPQFRKQGYGKKVLFEVLKLCRAATICAYIEKDNTNSIKLFTAFGFRPTSEDDGMICYKLGRPMQMNIRKAELCDIPKMMEIFSHAQDLMIKHNNPDQWARAYPNKQILTEGIEIGEEHVIEQDGKIIACFAVADNYFQYDNKELKWLNNEKYLCIKRFALATMDLRVIGSILDWCKSQTNNVRVDTGINNFATQKLLLKNGFVNVGKFESVNKAGTMLAFHKVFDVPIIRKATSADAAAVVDVILSAKLARYDFIDKALLEQERAGKDAKIKEFAERVDVKGLVTLVAEVDGKVVGVMEGIGRSFKPHYLAQGFGEICDCFVDPKFFGKGIGYELFKRTASELKNMGAQKFIIAVFKDNEKARHAYEKWGGKLDTYTEYREKEKQTTVFYLYDNL